MQRPPPVLIVPIQPFYSVAVLLSTAQSEHTFEVHIRVLATQVSTCAVDRVRAAIYIELLLVHAGSLMARCNCKTPTKAVVISQRH